MAQWFRDFRTESLGPAADMSVDWDATAPLRRQIIDITTGGFGGDTNFVGTGNVLELWPNTAGWQRHLFTGSPTGANMEVLLEYQVNGAGGNPRIGLFARGDADEAYVGGHVSSNNFGISYLSASGGSESFLGADGGNAQASYTWYRARLQISGTTVRGRQWAASGAEPETWDFSTTDSSFAGNASSFGGIITRNSTVAMITFIGIGTGGDAAPDSEPVAAVPTISSVTPSTITAGSNPVIAGTNLEAAQGTGTVKLSPTDDVADVNAVTQSITSWGDTSITLNGVSFPTGTSHNDTLYLFVTNDTGDSNAAGEAVTAYIAPTLTSPTAVSIGTTTVTPRVTTDTGNGTCYYVITPQAESEPSNAQVEAGTNAADGSPVASGSQVVSASGVITFSEVTGLTAGTAYRISYAHSGTPS